MREKWTGRFHLDRFHFAGGLRRCSHTRFLRGNTIFDAMASHILVRAQPLSYCGYTEVNCDSFVILQLIPAETSEMKSNHQAHCTWMEST